MSRRHSSRNYNGTSQAALPPPAPVPTPVSPQQTSTLSSLLSIFGPAKASTPLKFSLKALPTEELAGGISNMARGLVLNGNWWLVLLIIFLFFPNISSKMFGGLLRD